MAGPTPRSRQNSESSSSLGPYDKRTRKMASRNVSLPNLLSDLQMGRWRNHFTKKRLEEYAEETVVQLPFYQDKVDVPSSARSTFLMVFSPDGLKCASTHGDHLIYISDMKTGKIIQTLEGHTRTPWCIAFHNSLEGVLASGCLAGEVRVWDLRSGACEMWVNSHATVIASIAFHPIDHVVLIATGNELHFWDWRQSNQPFLTLTTSSDKERVRFVRFDSRGSKIITGISNQLTNHPPPLRSTHAAIVGHPQPPSFNFSPINSRNNDSSIPSPSSSSTPSSVGSLSPPIELEIERSNDAPEARRPSLWQRYLMISRQMDSHADSAIPSPSVASRNLVHEFQRSSSMDVADPVPGTSSSEPSPSPSSNLASAPVTPATSNNPMAEYSVNLMSTFRRLNSLCTRLAQLMQEQQTSSRLLDGERDIRSMEASSSLSDLLSRLQQSLQNMSTAALTTTIAQEHIQQVRQRVSEILERLVSVSGYRARLSNLRDQIYEVAERFAAGDAMAGSQGWDLLHCLWLVDMSIHLTRQMQRILAADYRLTQITLSSAQSSSSSNGASSSRGSGSTPPPFDLPPALTGDDSGRVRSFHPYSRWLSRSRSSSSSSTDSAFNIPLVRVSGPEGDSSSPSEEQPEHVFVREILGRERPRSPPLPEIQQVLSLSMNSVTSSVPPIANIPQGTPWIPSTPPGLPPRNIVPPRLANSQPFTQNPTGHIWFNSGNFPLSWSSVGELGHGLLGNGNCRCALSYRLQCWNFSSYSLPNLRDAQENIVVSKCRIQNDASVDMNSEGTLVAALVPIENSQSINLCIYSLESRNFAQCLYLWTFGPNAQSVSFSPLSRFVVVGLAGPRLPDSYISADITIGQVFQLKETPSGEYYSSTTQCLQHVRNINVNRGEDDLQNFSLNSIRWLPRPGGGFLYGTNRGHLVICRPKRPNPDDRCDYLKASFPGRTTIGTQTVSSPSSILRAASRTFPGRSLSIGTQTPPTSVDRTPVMPGPNTISEVE